MMNRRKSSRFTKRIAAVIMLSIITDIAVVFAACFAIAPPALTATTSAAVMNNPASPPLGYAMLSPNASPSYHAGPTTITVIFAKSPLPNRAAPIHIDDAIPSKALRTIAISKLPQQNPNDLAHFIMVGWPFPAHGAAAILTPVDTQLIGAVNLNPNTSLTILPYLPLWPGLLANLLSYGALYSILFLSADAFRARLRHRRRGKSCMNCGYPYSPDFEICPECGKTMNPIPRRHEPGATG